MTAEKLIYSQKVLDLVTLSVEYCKQVEQCRTMERERFIDVMRGLLPMLYLKASLLGEVGESMGYNEPCVTEADYDYVRHSVAAVMGDRDDYLDVFVEDFKYSDRPVLQTVSENLADIYQTLRDFAEVFRGGHDEAMETALFDVMDAFGTAWGQKLLNALRALHDSRFGGAAYE